jgi:hypothetical protein
MDIHGNRELIYKGDNNVWYAMPVKARKRPPVRPDLVTWPRAGEKAEEGVMYSADVYEGTEIPRGVAKYLRIIQMDAKTYSASVKTFAHGGPVVSIVQRDGVKRFLGTVPVEEDGSVHFKVPSGKALHFQLLDKDFRMIQMMRSFSGVMPGEARGCVGCHEQTSRAPVAFSGKAKAMQRQASEITPPPWGQEETISYLRFGQPILDKYCGKCHQGDKNPKARKKFDMTLRGGVPERGIEDPELLPFKEPYLTMLGPAWKSPIGHKKTLPGFGLAGALLVEGANGREIGPIKPMTVLSYTSPLIKMVREGKHHDVKIEGEDLRRLMAWVDSNCVYRGDKEIRMIDDYPHGAKLPVPALIKNAPRIDRLQPINDDLSADLTGFLEKRKAKEISAPPIPISILSAIYGTDEKRADVTDKLSKLSARNAGGVLDVGNYNSAFGNPHPRKLKELTVKYVVDGKESTKVFSENHVMRFK